MFRLLIFTSVHVSIQSLKVYFNTLRGRNNNVYMDKTFIIMSTFSM